MAETRTVPEPVATNTSDDDLSHTVCFCDTNTALCGTDVTDADWDNSEDDDCIVCDYLDTYYDQIGTCCRLGAEHDCG